jgi:hypothetical protein
MRRLAELDASARDAAHVEQVVHEARHLPDLTLEHLGRGPHRVRRRARRGRSTRAALAIGASGLRSSCASIARNSFLRRSASERSAASRRRVVLGTLAVGHVAHDLGCADHPPLVVPERRIVSDTRMRLPSARIRSVSK